MELTENCKNSNMKNYMEGNDAANNLYIKTLTDKTIIIEYNKDDTILNLKEKIFSKEAVAVDCQRLIFAGVQLMDSNDVNKYNIQKNAILHLVLRFKNHLVM
jgi:large subunit ribosomal protein L40e